MKLFKLIHALGQAEKRYFKVYADRHTTGGQNQYVALFDQMARQGRYDEASLLNAFPGWSQKQFTDQKYYLKKMLLRSLRSYHASRSIDARIREYSANIEILADKGLYSLCKTYIKKGEKLALKYQKFAAYLSFLRWSSIIAQREADVEAMEQLLEQKLPQVSRIIKKYRNTFDYYKLNIRLSLLLLKKAWARGEDQLSAYEQIHQSPLLQNENEALTFTSKSIFYNLNSIYFSAQRDVQNAYKYRLKYIELLEQNPHWIKETPNNYVAGLNNLMVDQRELKKYEALLNNVQKLRNLSVRSENTKARIFATANDLELTAYRDLGEFDKGLERIPEVVEGMEQYGNMISREYQLLLQHDIFCIYFGAGQYAKALEWLNCILNSPSLSLREDMHCFLRIVNLIVHYELGHQDILDYLVRSTYRFLYKRDQLYRIETAILQFVKKRLPYIVEEQQLHEEFRDLQQELREITKDPFERKALHIFDVLSWLESKITHRPFAEVVRGKAESFK